MGGQDVIIGLVNLDLSAFDLSNLEENAPVSPARFNFTPPPGTQILDTE